MFFFRSTLTSVIHFFKNKIYRFLSNTIYKTINTLNNPNDKLLRYFYTLTPFFSTYPTFLVEVRITLINYYSRFKIYLIRITIYFKEFILKTIGDAFLYLRGLFIVFFVDALIIDDEPL